MICPFCKEEKPRADFGAEPRKFGVQWWCLKCNANRAAVRKHGLTNEQKAEIAAAHGGCAICGHAQPSSRGWVVDHDHECCPSEKSCPKCRRGIICSWCNALLGNAFDRPQILSAALEYLERHATGICDWHMPVACSERICGNAIRASSTDGQQRTDSLRTSVTLGNESHVSNAREQSTRSIAVEASR